MIIQYHKEIGEFESYVLGGDLGGTNTKLGIAGVKNGITTPLFMARFQTQEIGSLVPAIEETLDYARQKHGIEAENACFGVAGIVSHERDYCKLTNASWDVSTKDILDKVGLRSATLLNDFEAIGYGIEALDLGSGKDILKLKPENRIVNGNRALMGAGTGVGKSILIYRKGTHIPIASEGGHMDFPVQNSYELELINFIKKSYGANQVSYEDIISGKGIESIYMFLKERFPETQCTKEIEEEKDKVPVIAKYKNIDAACTETFRLYAKFYGRCARNFVLDYIPRGGLFIAGGIAARHRDIFTSEEFGYEFHNCDRQRKVLQEIPIYIVLNIDTGLFGACCYAAK
ncbi:glucokinase [Candidatus Micrarchaeota archaeon]|nr:glucokinase [Candidatus Micrarchaeota archaeon]